MAYFKVEYSDLLQSPTMIKNCFKLIWDTTSEMIHDYLISRTWKKKKVQWTLYNIWPSFLRAVLPSISWSEVHASNVIQYEDVENL